ncbi:MAG TPA: Eco57I restriction-modification methylase domain-containing protein [Jatrophihabitans sp.]|nr:Eco57I restriction-modification methylase domain-containing protein [Jatrophihabitans sp.]
MAATASKKARSKAVAAFLQGVEERRLAVQRGLDAKSQDAHGQVFTPIAAASIIAGLPTLPKGRKRLRILDPGAGVGSLSAALLGRILIERPGVVAVDLVCIELDHEIAPHLAATLAECSMLASSLGVELTITQLNLDVLDLVCGLDQRADITDGEFDLVIMNPPFYKLDKRIRDRLVQDGLDAPNIYAVFLLIGARALASGGQLVAITPRSFANGAYFEPFRRRFLGAVALDRMHQFDSRGTVFSDGGVLQETVIFSATKHGHRTTVTVTFSTAADDQPTSHTVQYSDVIDPSDGSLVVRIPTSTTDIANASVIDALPCLAADLGIRASTGKVVDFRARKKGLLVHKPNDHTIPMIFRENLREGRVVWPLPDSKKEQGIVPSTVTDAKSIPSERYVLVKRFSSREEKRRIIAVVYEPDDVTASDVGFDNMLNYFHAADSGLERDFAWGLCLWLNSTAVDDHYRTISGSTQVNATDLNKTMRYPHREALCALGNAFGQSALPEQAKVDALVEEHIFRQLNLVVRLTHV